MNPPPSPYGRQIEGVRNMRINFSTFLTSAILAGVVSSSPGFSDEADLARVEAALAAERANLEASSPFISTGLLDELHRLSPEDLSNVARRVNVDVELLRRGLQEVELIEAFRERAAQGGLILETGCFRARAGGFEHELPDPEGGQLNLEDLVGRAYAVLIVRITEVQSGYYKGLGTRVVAEVEEVLGPTPLSLQPQDRLEYFQGSYTITVGEVGVCAERPGFREARPGDRVLLLAAPPTSYQGPDTLVTSSTFPIQGERVEMQPYPFLLQEASVHLDTLRAKLEAR